MTARRTTSHVTSGIALTIGMSCGIDTDAREAIVNLEGAYSPVAYDGETPSLKSVSAVGSGCPAGSTTLSMADDGSLLALNFEQYAISLSAQQTPAISQRPCNISFHFQLPAGMIYGFESVELAGQAQLEAGMQATVLVDAAYTGFGVPPGFKTSRLDLTSSGNFTLEAVQGQVQWASCEVASSLQLRTRITLAGAGSGHVRLLRLGMPRIVTRPCRDSHEGRDGGAAGGLVDGGVAAETGVLMTLDGGLPTDDGSAPTHAPR